MQTLKCYDECKEVWYELGRWFSGDMTPNQTTGEMGCYLWGGKNDGCNGCESSMVWISKEAPSGNPNSYREVCRRNGKYGFLCYITHIERLIAYVS